MEETRPALRGAGGAEAITWLNDAAETLAGTGARQLRAECLLDLGTARWEAGQREAARADLRSAGELAEQCGAKALLTRSSLLPDSAVRNDYRTIANHRYECGPPLTAPITALAGTDDPVVSVADAQAQEQHTVGAFALEVLPGGHFYPVSRWEAVAGFVRRDLFHSADIYPRPGYWNRERGIAVRHI